MDVAKLLAQLSETPGASGDETAIAALILKKWKKFASSTHIDRMGNVIAIKKGRGKKPRRQLLVAAHMDEIGLMVSNIESFNENGFIKMTNVGGVDVRHLYGQRVVVHGTKDLPGIIGALPKKMLPENKRRNCYDFESLAIDVGLPASELEEQVAIGDFITFYQPLIKLQGNRVAGKALDNRASVAALTVTLEYLSKRRHKWDLVAVATVQEETRLLGAATSAYAIHPDVALAIDVTFGKGPGTTDSSTFELGGGVPLGMGPQLHPKVLAKLQGAAGALEMKTHLEPHVYHTGTDASALNLAHAGIPTGLLGIPLRYMHTMVESLDVRDIKRAGRLMGEFTAQLDEKFIDQLQVE